MGAILQARAGGHPVKNGKDDDEHEQFIRQGHRWVAMLFTFLVATNFAAMIGGSPPAWLTYSPLVPLLLLLLTGLTLLVQHYAFVRRAKANP